MRSTPVSALLGILLVTVARLASAGTLDKPAFTATPQELLAEARAVAGTDAGVVILSDDHTIRFDDTGRAEHRYRIVAAILKPGAVDDWGTVFVDWRPFYQERPTIRARVVAPDGSVAEIDPKLFHDTPTVSESPTIFSDRRQLQAPLPRLAVGAVFEEEMVIRGRAPLLAEGEVNRSYIGRGVPVSRNTVTIDAPTRLGVTVVTRGFAKAPVAKPTTRAGRTTWRFDLGATPALAGGDVGLPGDQTAYPYIGVTTGKDWASIAAGYRRLVDDKLKDPLALPAGLKAATQRATVDRTLAWLHANIRYTGIELRDSAIIPFTPAETIARGFGDCKDKATLLVALLRASGIPADVVLVSTGPGNDVDRALPGMGEFDHAIVRARVDGKDLWIDATEDGLPAGQLPARDQGRLALVIAPGTKRLTMTPAAAAADNLVREVRTFTLAEIDWATVREVTTERGVYWNNLRGWTRDSKRADIDKSLAQYVERQYSGRLRSFTADDPGEVTKPFSLVVEVDKVTRAYTSRAQADVYLFPTDTLSRLPDIVDAESKELDGDVARRTADYVWHTPHVYEIENRIVIPPGHVAPPITGAPVKRALGTMTLTTTRRMDGGVLVVTYRLDTGPRKITAAQLRATRTATLAFQRESSEHLLIAQTGAMLLDAGKIEEAIAEYQRLIALHPKEGLHHGQLAEAYSRVGMGAAARRAARRRVALEPGDADAHVVLATQLGRDSVGKEFGFDADRDGAIAAYRKALALNPEHVGALAGLAWLLSNDRHGWLSDNQRDLGEAVELWRRAKELDDDEDYDLWIAERLLDAGRFAEAETAARALPRSDAARGIELAAVASTRGAPAAVTLARSMASGAERSRILTEARGRLLRMRSYALMREIHAAIGGATSPQQAAMFAAIEKTDLGRLAPADPRTPVYHALRYVLGRQPTTTPWSTDVGDTLLLIARASDALPQMRAMREVSAACAVDLMTALAELTVEGTAATGWRVSSTSSGQHMSFYVRAARGRAEIVGLGGMNAGLGREIRARLAAKDVDGARAWLAWFVEDLGRVAMPKSPATEAVSTLFREELAAAGRRPSREPLEVAAALLVAEHDEKTAIPTLRRCGVKSADVTKACRIALISLLLEQRAWKEAAEIAAQLPDDAALAPLRARTLVLGGQARDGLAHLDTAIAANPRDAELLTTRAYLTIVADGFTKAEPLLERAALHAEITERQLNTLAWTRAFHDTSMTRALELARRAEKLAPNISEGMANTLALVEAEAGNVHTAWTYLQRSLHRLSFEPPADDDWYVYGRIAEELGLTDDAIEAYRRIKPQPAHHALPTASDFAARALKRLGAAPAPAPARRK